MNNNAEEFYEPFNLFPKKEKKKTLSLRSYGKLRDKGILSQFIVSLSDEEISSYLSPLPKKAPIDPIQEKYLSFISKKYKKDFGDFHSFSFRKAVLAIRQIETSLIPQDKRDSLYLDYLFLLEKEAKYMQKRRGK